MKKPPSLFKFKPDQRKREAGILAEVITTRDYPVARVTAVVGTLPTFRLANATDENPAFEKALERHMAPHRKAKDEGKHSEGELAELYNELYRGAFVEASILGWYNVTDEHGAPLEFDAVAAAALMAEIPEVENCLIGAATDRRNFRIDLAGSPEADAKNS